MAVRILVIQFRLPDAARAEREPIARVLEGTCELVFKNGLAREVYWAKPERELRNFDGVILSGSSVLYFDGGHMTGQGERALTNLLVDDARSFVRYVMEHNIPTLGICFGHQLLGYAAGTDVGHSSVEGKTGTYKVQLTEAGKNDPLMRGISSQFLAHYGHKDVLRDLPQGATVLAHGNHACHFSALKYSDNVYSVQFHPEFSREEIQEMVSKFPEYVPGDAKAEELFEDSEEAEQILKNFVSVVAERK